MLVKKSREKSKVPQSITELRNELNEVFFELRNGTLKPQEAKEIVNSAGKIINTVKVQIDYSTLMGRKDKIDYLEKQ